MGERKFRFDKPPLRVSKGGTLYVEVEDLLNSRRAYEQISSLRKNMSRIVKKEEEKAS